MSTTEFTTPNQTPKKPRWIKSRWSRNELNGKRVFARFTASTGASHEGTGAIRVGESPRGLLAIDLVFTRYDSPYQRTDILFHLSARQLRHLKKSKNNAEHDVEYEGRLVPDNQPETPEKA